MDHYPHLTDGERESDLPKVTEQASGGAWIQICSVHLYPAFWRAERFWKQEIWALTHSDSLERGPFVSHNLDMERGLGCRTLNALDQ